MRTEIKSSKNNLNNYPLGIRAMWACPEANALFWFGLCWRLILGLTHYYQMNRLFHPFQGYKQLRRDDLYFSIFFHNLIGSRKRSQFQSVMLSDWPKKVIAHYYVCSSQIVTLNSLQTVLLFFNIIMSYES